MILRILIVLPLAILWGCTRGEPTIAPVILLQPTPHAIPLQPNPIRTPTAVELPTPHVAKVGAWNQSDAGLLLSILAMQVQRLDPQDQRDFKYAILKLSIRNLWNAPRDVAGFPQTVWLQTADGGETFDSEPYAVGDDNLWRVIDGLSKSRTKPLLPAQSVSGSLYFSVPLTGGAFEVVWQPIPQRQWLLGPFQIH
jgi:hypothetical protein